MASERIRLRPWQPSDLAPLQLLRNDVSLQAQLLSRARGSDEAAVRTWLERKAAEPTTLFWVVADAASDAALGYLQFTGMDPIDRTANLGICLAPNAQGRGLGTEALAAAIDCLRRTNAARKVTLRVRGDNTAAIACYRRAAFVDCGRMRRHVCFDGVLHDVVLMEMFLGDGEAR